MKFYFCCYAFLVFLSKIHPLLKLVKSKQIIQFPFALFYCTADTFSFHRFSCMDNSELIAAVLQEVILKYKVTIFCYGFDRIARHNNKTTRSFNDSRCAETSNYLYRRFMYNNHVICRNGK